MKVLEVITAEEAGFCFGVERAIDMVLEAAGENEDMNVYTLGPLIHNPQVVKKLEAKNVKVASSLAEIDSGIVIIRSHGVAPEIIKQAREKNLKIIDATCPYVKNAQKYAKKLVDEGYQTFIYGDQDHPEVQGIYGASDKKAIIIKGKEDLNSIELKARVGFVAQTTKSPESFRDIINLVITEVKELKVFNTICNTTDVRQSSAKKLAEDVDIMFVIGGHNSANTTRLAEICAATNTPTYHIETAAEINKEWLSGKNKVGITAGASTPDWLIREVIQLMNEENKDLNVESTENVEEKEEQVLEEVEETVEETEETTEKTEETTEEKEADNSEEAAESAEEEVAEEDAETEEEAEFKYSDNDIADLSKGQKVTGTVVEINDNGVYVDVNYKTDGFIPLRHLSHRPVEDANDIVSMDEEIEVVILTLEDDEGNMILSKKQADYEKAWEKIEEAYENNEIIEAEVTKEVKGGLVVDVGVRGFIPASHVAIGYVDDLSDYVGEKMRLKIIEVERDNNNVVLSAKKVLEKERAAEKEETLAALEEGQTVEGTVTKLVDFGAFIDLGGIEGLLHISEMSWGRIESPSEVLSEGEKVEVKVLGVNKEEERISLGLKQLLPDPWEEFADKHYEGEVVEGKITKLVDFGAFMEVEKGIEGLIHISQLSHRHVKTADEVVSVGDVREAKIINIDADQERVGLSLKELEEKPEPKKESSSSSRSSSSSSKSRSNKSDDSSSSGGATIREIVGDIFDQGE
ncbi:4-hydroxy-3-methylbut-2-enyl diphosphate reductase [Halanaerobium saccharolyticum]|uniref:4-hydroxy-3-methylbut-2-enyl diphosphate reductase n=1 Tax=Halanaerobium saccharolyticum TaxID=43595 RepID=A0A4R7YWL0_9FIRM|nr:bifunctional 4-hydroxy-3-methylbut-2-enyl diphosphate reductase/30S ribosomal protein S1 [Halanaerobium saccharolyticum]RAK06197.1 4-hydroxy-3-methylbut-2-enyl diphosphate reductase [Halanaerobium saccharolyticum]TDW00562.1 4-hydroxy-3-methylbut-2-enyl diphosphate reductase [Halanaerobium saccharolyticum]TDX52227.1 4-hydroxy-3-methylbut-2-enyl diphosphate reductase [Halanaerobium saccharolyticum]